MRMSCGMCICSHEGPWRCIRLLIPTPFSYLSHKVRQTKAKQRLGETCEEFAIFKIVVSFPFRQSALALMFFTKMFNRHAKCRPDTAIDPQITTANFPNILSCSYHEQNCVCSDSDSAWCQRLTPGSKDQRSNSHTALPVVATAQVQGWLSDGSELWTYFIAICCTCWILSLSSPSDFSNLRYFLNKNCDILNTKISQKNKWPFCYNCDRKISRTAKPIAEQAAVNPKQIQETTSAVQ